MSTVNRIVDTPLSNTIKGSTKGNNAIITLGYALNPDGSMNEILIERLNATLTMANWLVKNGIDKSRTLKITMLEVQ